MLFQGSSATFKEEGMMMGYTTWDTSFPRHQQHFDKEEE
jgi:hypothetical protein